MLGGSILYYKQETAKKQNEKFSEPLTRTITKFACYCFGRTIVILQLLETVKDLIGPTLHA